MACSDKPPVIANFLDLNYNLFPGREPPGRRIEFWNHGKRGTAETISMFKFLHAADIHLDSPLRGLERYEGAPVEEIRSAARRAFDNLVNLAIEEEVSFVLLAGDLYDGDWKDYNTGLYFVQRMGRLHEAGIPVFLIKGNHDAASQITRHLRLPENVKKLSDKKPQQVVLEDHGVAINGQGFASRSVADDLSEKYPQGEPDLFNIGLLHTCLDGKRGHDPYSPCTVDGLRSKGYQYWALGHVHNREEVSRDPWIVFPGNIQGRHARETGSKGCTLVTVDNNQVQTVQERSLDVFRWLVCSVDLSATETADGVYNQVRDALQDTLDSAEGRPVATRVILTGTCPIHARLHSEFEYWEHEYRAIATGFASPGLWLEKLSIQTRPPTSSEELGHREDALSGLLKAIRELELGEEMPAELLDEMNVLRQKLPPELLTGEESSEPTELVQFKAALDSVKEMLTMRLLTGDQG
jgi:DNA repair exonuclease SbcCD nuclease subunit